MVADHSADWSSPTPSRDWSCVEDKSQTLHFQGTHLELWVLSASEKIWFNFYIKTSNKIFWKKKYFENDLQRKVKCWPDHCIIIWIELKRTPSSQTTTEAACHLQGTALQPWEDFASVDLHSNSKHVCIRIINYRAMCNNLISESIDIPMKQPHPSVWGKLLIELNCTFKKLFKNQINWLFWSWKIPFGLSYGRFILL